MTHRLVTLQSAHHLARPVRYRMGLHGVKLLKQDPRRSRPGEITTYTLSVPTDHLAQFKDAILPYCEPMSFVVHEIGATL